MSPQVYVSNWNIDTSLTSPWSTHDNYVYSSYGNKTDQGKRANFRDLFRRSWRTRVKDNERSKEIILGVSTPTNKPGGEGWEGVSEGVREVVGKEWE